MSNPNEYFFEEFLSTLPSVWLKEYCQKLYGNEITLTNGELDEKFIKGLLRKPEMDDKHAQFRMDVFDIFCVGNATDQLMLNANRLIIYRSSLAKKIFKTSELSEEEKKTAKEELNDLENLLSGTETSMEFSREIFVKRPDDFCAILVEFLLSKNPWESTEYKIPENSVKISDESINTFKERIVENNNQEEKDNCGPNHILYFLHHQKGHLLILRQPNNYDYESTEILTYRGNGSAPDILKIMALEHRQEFLFTIFKSCFCV